jgi:hypothetical protein
MGARMGTGVSGTKVGDVELGCGRGVVVGSGLSVLKKISLFFSLLTK